MRANEFIVEEGPVSKLGGWMSRQSVERKQMDKEKAIKRNVPKIVTAVQELLSNYVADAPQEQINDIVIAVLAKSTKVDLESNADLFAKPIQDLLNTISTNPSEIESSGQVRKLLTDIIGKAFTLKHSPKYTNAAALKYYKAQRKEGKSKEEATAATVKKYDVEPEDIGAPGDERPSATGRKYPETPTTEVPERTETGMDVSDLITDLQDFLKADPKTYADDEDTLAVIKQHLEKDEVGLPNVDVRDAIIDEIMSDPNLPSSPAVFDDEFRALVHSPNGLRHKKDGDGDGDNVAFVKHKGKWSRWHIGERSSWRLIDKKITSERDLKSLFNLDQAGSTALQPLMFRKEEIEGAKNLYRVSTR